MYALRGLLEMRAPSVARCWGSCNLRSTATLLAIAYTSPNNSARTVSRSGPSNRSTSTSARGSATEARDSGSEVGRRACARALARSHARARALFPVPQSPLVLYCTVCGGALNVLSYFLHFLHLWILYDCRANSLVDWQWPAPAPSSDIFAEAAWKPPWPAAPSRQRHPPPCSWSG